jgi:hypothetical protein
MTLKRRLLLDAPFYEPSKQELYASASRASEFARHSFSEWFVANVASGNLVGSEGTTLTAGGGTIRYQRKVPGWNGVDMMSGFKAVEFLGTDSTAESFAAGSTSLWDLNQSLCFVGCARLARPPAANRGIFGKRAGSAASFAGYTIQIDNSVGSLRWFAVQFDLTALKGRIYGGRTVGADVVLPSGVKTNSTAFRIGGNPFQFSCELFQLLAFGVLVGAEAEAFDLAALNRLDNWCRAPEILTYSRASMTAPTVAVDSYGSRVQHCSGSASRPELVHCAYLYLPNATRSPQKLGLAIFRGLDAIDTTLVSKRNRLLDTDDLSASSWTKTNVTVTKNAGEDPGGFHGMPLLAATADNGTVIQNWTADLGDGSPAKTYTQSLYFMRGGGSDVTFDLQVIRTDTSAVVATVALTATALCQRVGEGAVAGLEFSAPVTGLRFQIKLRTSGDSIYATYAQAEYGNITPYQPQRGALVDRGYTMISIDNTYHQYYNPVAGKVEVVVVGVTQAVHPDTTGRYLFTVEPSDPNTPVYGDRHYMQRDDLAATHPTEAVIHDADGTIVSQLQYTTPSDGRAEIVYTSEWDSTGALDGEAQLAVLSQDEAIGRSGDHVRTTPWGTIPNLQASTATKKIYVCQRHNQVAHLEGGLERLRIWGPAAAPAGYGAGPIRRKR